MGLSNERYNEKLVCHSERMRQTVLNFMLYNFATNKQELR